MKYPEDKRCVCNREETSQCQYCGYYFCSDHITPSIHNCIGIDWETDEVKKQITPDDRPRWLRDTRPELVKSLSSEDVSSKFKPEQTIQEEHKVERVVGKILGITSFIFGVLGIVGLIGAFSSTSVPFSAVTQFSFYAIVLGAVAYIIGREKKFAHKGVILGAITLGILIYIVLMAYSSPGA